MTEFQLVSSFAPAGSQPDAIKELTKGLEQDKQYQTLLGVTGSGKTFTMANVIAAANTPLKWVIVSTVFNIGEVARLSVCVDGQLNTRGFKR